MNRKLFGIAFAVVLSVFFGNGCKGPTSPTQILKFVPNPKPAPGMSVHSIPLPETDEPLLLWIQTLSPEKDGQLVVGQQAFLEWTCGGPGGYIAHIATRVIQDGVPDREPPRGGNSILIAGGKCEMEYARQNIEVNASTLGVRAYKFYIWVAKGNTTTFDQGRPPDAILEEAINWKAPQ